MGLLKGGAVIGVFVCGDQVEILNGDMVVERGDQVIVFILLDILKLVECIFCG